MFRIRANVDRETAVAAMKTWRMEQTHPGETTDLVKHLHPTGTNTPQTM